MSHQHLHAVPHEIPLEARIFVAGHRGLVGLGHPAPARARASRNLLTATRDQLDLRDQAAVNTGSAPTGPSTCSWWRAPWAASMANSTRPAEFIYDNLMIHATVVHASAPARVRRAALPRQLVHLPPRVPAADHRGGPAHRAARAHQRGVRRRQDLRHQALPGLPRAVRLRLHLGHAHQPLRPERQLRPHRLARAAGADAASSTRPARRRGRGGGLGHRHARGASCCTSTTWPTPASS